MKRTLIWFGVLLFVGFALQLSAQSELEELRPVTRTYALKNVTIIPQPGQKIESGVVIIKNGLIEAVGANVPIPPDAKVLETDSMYVYPGFIDGLSNTGIPRPSENEGERAGRGNRPENPGNPSNEEAGITPEAGVRDHLNPKDRSIDEMRRLGFTVSHTIPRGRMLPGQGALIILSGKQADEMILRDQTALAAQLEGGRRVYPATVIAVMAKFRELYRQAEQAMAHEKAYAANPAGLARPSQDRVLQALYPVIENGQPVFFVAEDVKSAYRVLTLQEDLGFPLVLAELKEGFHIADQLKARQVPVFLSLDLPEDKSGGDKKEEKAEAEKKQKEEGADQEKKKPEPEMSEEMKKLEARRAEAMAQHIGQAALLVEKGIPFGFSTLNAKSKDIRANLRRLIGAGLSEDDALAALTTQPARLLGIEGITGTVAKGKIANLVVTDEPYFAEKSNVRFVIVDGEVHEYEAKPKRKGDPNAKVSVAGKWSYSIDAGGQALTGVVELIDNNGEISGTVTSAMGGDPQPIRNAVLSGNNLTFSTNFDAGGQTVSVDYSLIIDGNFFEGSASTPSYGTFDMEGERLSPPDRR